MAHLHYGLYGFAFVLADLAILAGVFITANLSQKDERIKKQEIQTQNDNEKNDKLDFSFTEHRQPSPSHAPVAWFHALV
jgi:cell division protein ZapA (FtsZ GTPase activity inhibitor)